MAEAPAAVSRSTSLAVTGLLLAAWFAVSFGALFFARDLQFAVAGWPFSYWLAAQGAVLVFMGIVVLYAWWMNRVEARQAAAERKDG